MTKIKDLKSKPENNLNIIEILELICPEKKTKYIETLLRLMKKTKNYDNYIVDIKEMLTKKLNISSSKLEKFTNLQIFLMWNFLEINFDINDLVEYRKFCDFNERGLIQSNDLSKYSSFNEILSVTSIAELKSQEKELEKQIKVIYTNEEWTVIRPLTGNSSMKYGSGTKWCTASTKNPDYFFRYSKRGILLYMINKKTGLKVACFKSLDEEHEFSFWNQEDIRIDSIESGLPLFIIDIIRDEITNNPVSNMSLLSDEEKKIQEDLLGYRLNKYSASEIQPIEMDISNLYDSFDSVSMNERRLSPPMPEDMDLTIADVPRNFG